MINGQFKMISDGVLTDKSSASELAVKILAVERNVVFAVYKQGEKEGILITNFDEPTSGRENTVTVKVVASEARVFSAGEKEKIRCDGGELKYQLKSGEAIFVSPCGR